MAGNKSLSQFLNFSKGQLIRFLLLSAFMFFFYYISMISLTLFLFFEIILLIQFIHIKKYLEMKLLNHYPAYEHLPGWAKWAIIIIAYLLIFMLIKWILINIVLEGIFHIPINNELQEIANYSSTK